MLKKTYKRVGHDLILQETCFFKAPPPEEPRGAKIILTILLIVFVVLLGLAIVL